MDKSQTLILKGVAILMMLYLHLFNTLDATSELCENFIYISGLPFSYILTRCANPVIIYIILSGYGLYRSYSVSKLPTHGCNSIKRVIKLYIHYWITLLIFIPICSWVNPAKYPGGIIDIVSNMTGWHTTYNGEIWFLFPYACLILCSESVFRVVNRVPRLSILCSIAFYLVTYYICWRYGAFLRANIWVYKIVLVANFLLPFVIGVFLAKYHIIEQTKKLFRNRTPLLLSLLVLAVFLRCCTNFDAIHIIYSSILVVLLAAIDFPDKFKEIFSMLGKRSTSMWFVHTYFATICFVILFTDLGIR